jgi:hypothetical protein
VLFSPGWRAPVRQGGVLAVFAVGLVAGGTLVGSALWLLSGLAHPLPAAAGMVAAVIVAALGVLREVMPVIRRGADGRVRLPQNARQIPAAVLRHRLRAGALRFGFELGTGVRTYLSSSAPHVVAVILLLTHPPPVGFLAAGAGFGLGRAATAALALTSRSPNWNRWMATHGTWNVVGVSVALLSTLVVRFLLHG